MDEGAEPVGLVARAWSKEVPKLANNGPNSRLRLAERESSDGPVGALICAGVALLGALVFWVPTAFAGSYPAVARLGGALWTFVPMMIVLMPIVIPRLNKLQMGRRKPS